MKIRWRKGISSAMAVVILASTVLSSSTAMANATTPTQATDGANETSRSMISFFREERTGLQVERTSKEEVKVYGVFLSNFFVPYHTKLGDIINDEGDNSFPKQVSNKFFGSTGKSKDVLEINKKVYEAISDVLGFKEINFAMLKTKGSDKAMTGADLIAKMSGADSDKKVYGLNNKVYMDLSDPAFQATFQLLYGFSPDMFFGTDKGLGKVTGLFVDGFGNVWGKYGKADIKDYVLILPASMNPSVFPKTGGYKLPLTNTIAMGATVKMTSDFLQSSSPNTPYTDFFSKVTSDYDKTNGVTIVGIQSPIGNVGNTGEIIQKGKKGNPWSKIKTFLDIDGSQSTTIPLSETSIMVTTNAKSANKLNTQVWNNKKYTKKNKANLINYLLRTTILPVSKVADNMYYFDVPLAPDTASGGEGSFGNIEDLITESRLFMKEADGGYVYHTNSYLGSPFGRFVYDYNKAKDKDKFLSGKLKTYKTSRKGAGALKDFLSKGTWGTKDASTIMDAMAILNSDKDLVYDFAPMPVDITNLVRDTQEFFMFDFDAYVEPVVFGLTSKDRDYALMSIGVKTSSAFKDFFKTFDTKTYPPFTYDKSGGTIAPKGEKLTDTETQTLSNFYFNLMTYRFFSMHTSFTKQLTGVKAGSKDYTSPLQKDKFKNGISIMNGINNYPGIYWGYMVELLGITPNSTGDGFNAVVPYVSEHLPAMDIKVLGGGLDLNEVFGDKGVVASEDRTLKEMQEDIVKKVYGILKDGESPHRDALIKNTQDSWIVSTHRAITGSWVGDALSVSAGGNGTYASTVGFVNTPSLLDIPLSGWVLKDYTAVYFFFIVLVLAVLIFLVIINMRRPREAITIFLFMLVILLLPQHLITNVTNISNKWGDNLFDGKFNYWAITQHEQSIKSLNTSRLSGSEIDYVVSSSLEIAKETYSNDVGVRLKWMSPKKDDYFDKLFNRSTNGQGIMENTVLFRWLFNSYMNQEEYVYDDPMATYLYRPYNAIAREAKTSYEALSDISVDKEEYINKVLTTSAQLKNNPDYRFDAYRDPTGQITYGKGDLDVIEKVKAFSTSKDVDKQEAYRYWLLGSDSLNTSIFRDTYTTSAGYTGSTSDKNYQAFSLMTESPFYYFYYALKSRYQTGDASFKSALLDEQLFDVTGVNNRVDYKTRDFLDMEGLFTYVVPYLQQANDYVNGWTSVYGKDVDSYDFEGGVNPVEGDALYDTYTYQKEKKDNLKNVWKLYSPWVDQISRQENLMASARLANKKVSIPDALDPSAYHSVGRPMLFSEADMYAKHYGDADLTSVESRIQRVLETTKRDMMYLTNYYDFDDEVLLTAGAMSATFNFNREFSETRLLGEDSTLYPQNYELKNFNFDAFMRLLLLNTTGEPLVAEGGDDLYVRVIGKTSIITGMFLIMSDIVGVILLPAMKVISLMLLLYLSIVVSVYCVITPPDRLLKTVWKAIGIPTLMYLLASGAFAWGISMLIGEGLTGYVGGRTPSLNMTDPTITIVLLIVMSLVYMFILWKLIVLLFKSLKMYSVGTAVGIVALGGAVASKAVGAVKDGIGGTIYEDDYSTAGKGVPDRDYYGNYEEDYQRGEQYEDFVETADNTSYDDNEEREYDSDFAKEVDSKVDKSGRQREEANTRIDNEEPVDEIDASDINEHVDDTERERVDLDSEDISKIEFDKNTRKEI